MTNIHILSKQFASKNNIYWERRMKVTSVRSRLDLISFVCNGELLFKIDLKEKCGRL